jgi:hypothetical protein
MSVPGNVSPTQSLMMFVEWYFCYKDQSALKRENPHPQVLRTGIPRLYAAVYSIIIICLLM